MNWIQTVTQKPPVNEVVLTKIDDGNGVRNIQKLVFYKNLWWQTDKSMYVYYNPTHWAKL